MRRAAVGPFQPDRHLAFEQHAAGMGFGGDGQVGPLLHRAQEGGRGAGAPAVLQRELVGADAVFAGAVEVGVVGQAELLARFQPGAAVGMVVAQVGHAQFAVAAVVFAGAAAVAFRAPEIGQHRAIVPAFRAHGGPAVVVGMLAADVEQAIDGAGAAQHTAARPDDAAVAAAFAGLGVEQAREARVVDGLEIAHRQVQPEVAVGLARFQQQHLHRRLGREPVGQHAAGRSGADDDVVVGARRRAAGRVHAFTVSR